MFLRNEVDVVGQYPRIRAPEGLQVEPAVVGGEEYRLPVNPTLGNMVRHAGDNQTRASRHICK